MSAPAPHFEYKEFTDEGVRIFLNDTYNLNLEKWTSNSSLLTEMGKIGWDVHIAYYSGRDGNTKYIFRKLFA